MPVINQQKNELPITGDPIARIMDVSAMPAKRITVSLYGRPKTGKTRLISTFPKPVLIIGTEDGTASISNVKDVKFVQIYKTAEVPRLVEYANKNGFKTTALDNATMYQSLVLAEMLGLEKVPIQHQRGVMKKVDNQEYSALTKEGINELFKFKGNVIITAHERNFDDKPKDDEGNSTVTHTATDSMLPTITSALSKGVCGWLNGICDYVCQTFIRSKMIEQDFGDGLKNLIASDEGEYCLRIGAHPIFMTGFRVPVGAAMPNVIVNPSYDKMMEVIKGKWKEPTEQLA